MARALLNRWKIYQISCDLSLRYFEQASRLLKALQRFYMERRAMTLWRPVSRTLNDCARASSCFSYWYYRDSEISRSFVACGITHHPVTGYQLPPSFNTRYILLT